LPPIIGWAVETEPQSRAPRSPPGTRSQPLRT